ncbi:MAG: group 1 glycosyl transferase, partial [Verrucomicrobiota bacterium]
MDTCLIIGKVWPEPSSTAAGRRTLDIIQALIHTGRRVVFASAALKNEHCASLSVWDVEEQNIKLNDSSFDEWVKGLNPDVVIFDRFMTEEQFGWRVERSIPSAIRILDTSDLHLLREARRVNTDTNNEIDLFHETALREIGSIYRSDLTLLISEAEIKILKETFGIEASLVEYWPFSIKTNHFSDEPSYQERQDCVMLGSFMHPPNVDSVRWCVSEIWPQIRRRLPDVELHIYGSYSDDFKLPEKTVDQGVFLKGRMGDVSKEL